MDLFLTTAGVVRWIDSQASRLDLAGFLIRVVVDGASTTAGVIWWINRFERLNIWVHRCDLLLVLGVEPGGSTC